MQTYEAMLDGDLDRALEEGSTHFEGESAVHKTMHRVAQRLDELGIEYAVMDGMAIQGSIPATDAQVLSCSPNRCAHRRCSMA